MDNQTLMYIVVGVLSLFFIVLTVFNVKTWRFLHVFFALLLFVAMGFYLYFAAAVLKTRAEWMPIAQELKARAAEKERLANQLRGGTTVDDMGQMSGTETTIAAMEKSLAGLEAEIHRVTFDQGRVYHGATSRLGASINDPIDVELLTAATATPPAGEEGGDAEPADGDDAAEEEPAEPEPTGRHTIDVDQFVHVFSEGPSRLSGELEVPEFGVPDVYLGKFIVRARTETGITIESVIPINPRQQAAMELDVRWTVYAKSPHDTHAAFAGLSEEDLRALFRRDRMTISDGEYDQRNQDLAEYFDDQTPEQLAANVPKDNLLLSDAEYDEFIQRYAQDLEEIDPADKDNYPDERLWRKVTFLKDHQVDVDEVSADDDDMVDEDEEIAAEETELEKRDFTSEFYNIRGLAIDPRLQHGGQVEFGIGDEGIFDPISLSRPGGLLEQEVIDSEDLEYVYVRQLKHYEMFFTDRYTHWQQFKKNAAVMQQETNIVADVDARATRQLAIREDEKTKLQADLVGFQRQNAALDKLLADLTTAHSVLNTRLGELYRGNIELASRIRSYQQRLAVEIERQIRERSAQPPSTPAPASGAVSAP